MRKKYDEALSAARMALQVATSSTPAYKKAEDLLRRLQTRAAICPQASSHDQSPSESFSIALRAFKDEQQRLERARVGESELSAEELKTRYKALATHTTDELEEKLVTGGPPAGSAEELSCRRQIAEASFAACKIMFEAGRFTDAVNLGRRAAS
eukprot:tig00000471_g1184.t1